MATHHATQELPAADHIETLPYPSGWPEQVRLALTLVVFGALVVSFAAGATLAVISVGPMVGSVAGTAGILAVWLVGIGVVVSTPRLAMYCINAVGQAR